MTSPNIYFSIALFNHPPFLHCNIGKFKIKHDEIIDS